MDPEFSVLPNGEYHIFSKATDFVVGRKLAEDKSLRPKGIYTLDPNVNPTGGRKVRPHVITRAFISNGLLQWTIEHVGEGKYKMKAGGATVGELEGLLWAFLLEEEQQNATEWRIQGVPQMGEDCYM